jgi:hypothetical protein
MIFKINKATNTVSFNWWYHFIVIVHIFNDKTQFKEFEDAIKDQHVVMGNNAKEKVV